MTSAKVSLKGSLAGDGSGGFSMAATVESGRKCGVVLRRFQPTA